MRYNGNRFSVYASEEKTVLGLLDELGTQVNHNTDNLEKISVDSSKKVTHEEIKNIYKLDETGNFTGSWFGLSKPTLTDEGLKATVEELKDNKIPSIETSLDTITKDIADINLLAQGTLPAKQSISSCGKKLALKVSEDIYKIIQPTNKGYVAHTFKKGNGDTSSASAGENFDF